MCRLIFVSIARQVHVCDAHVPPSCPSRCRRRRENMWAAPLVLMSWGGCWPEHQLWCARLTSSQGQCRSRRPYALSAGGGGAGDGGGHGLKPTSTREMAAPCGGFFIHLIVVVWRAVCPIRARPAPLVGAIANCHDWQGMRKQGNGYVRDAQPVL